MCSVAHGGASCAPSGSGDIDEGVVLPMGSIVQFLLMATVAELPETPMTKIASLTPPASIGDPALSNNVATDGPDIRGLSGAGIE